eukprot:CAMPEP_0115049648 /NCGR_PEP_ID=MMETSP0227-20121206/1323_1 /TAXON_ID=89957 /ORGANISM="Polarella glacialis, Strain CCMP 1383" /LENGTH=722 /DNA_ID=CAMNT_0002433371 /DNA_START=47 /DNA_END=2216 /DNA_ORIENTATION=-
MAMAAATPVHGAGGGITRANPPSWQLGAHGRTSAYPSLPLGSSSSGSRFGRPGACTWDAATWLRPWLQPLAAALPAAYCAWQRCRSRTKATSSRAAPASAVDVAGVDVSSEQTDRRGPSKGSAKRLSFGKSNGAVTRWGGAPITVRSDGLAQRSDEIASDEAKAQALAKWHPKPENWPGWVTDEEGEEVFGPLRIGHEVDILVGGKPLAAVIMSKAAKKREQWVPGVVTDVKERPDGTKVSLSLSTGGFSQATLGNGKLRRMEDAREICSEEELKEMGKLRSRAEADKLMRYGMSLKTTPARSQALVSLSRMGAQGLKCAEEMATVLPAKCLSSVALRELAHCHARVGDIKAALRHLLELEEVCAAQLLLEVLALGLTGRILREREASGMGFLRGVERNAAVEEVVDLVIGALPLLETYADAVRSLPVIDRTEGFTEPFNELLQSCGRAHAVPLAFRVMEWMEALTVPKDSFTYEAIGLNVTKRVALLRKVWDLPNAPEDEVCPEVVFAGRSNVGKSSLVNMLLNRTALAPTSARPGKTKTMDFFDVNSGHPALPRFRLVDVPGLGFARVSRDLRDRWIGLIGGYFVQRKSLKKFFHLLDAGLCEIMPADRELWRLLAQAKRTDYELCVVLTKADNTIPSQLQRFAKIVREALRQEGSELALHATIFACSSKSKLGKDTLWRKIWSAVGGAATSGKNFGDGPSNADRFRHEEFEGVMQEADQ